MKRRSMGLNNAKALRREAVRKFRQVGFWGTLKHGTARLVRDMLNLVFPRMEQADPFDTVYGTDTGGVLGVGSLDIPEDQMEHAVKYGAISEEEFTRLMKELPIAFEGLVFVDLGSGKGRALLLASRYPFKQIIGVEFSRMLHNIALRNIQVFRDDLQECRDIRSIHGDASTFEIPEVPLLFFLHNPFDDQVMRAVSSHIEGALRKYPRRMYIWYVKPEFRQVFDGTDCLRLVKETGRYVVYESIA